MSTMAAIDISNLSSKPCMLKRGMANRIKKGLEHIMQKKKKRKKKGLKDNNRPGVNPKAIIFKLIKIKSIFFKKKK